MLLLYKTLTDWYYSTTIVVCTNLVSCLMLSRRHLRQKLCPHGVVHGLTQRSRQMVHANSSCSELSRWGVTALKARLESVGEEGGAAAAVVAAIVQ